MVWSSFIGCLASGDIHNLHLIQNSNYLTNKRYQKVVPHIRKTWGVRIVWEIYFKDEKAIHLPLFSTFSLWKTQSCADFLRLKNVC